jgi:hypothetical protein
LLEVATKPRGKKERQITWPGLMELKAKQGTAMLLHEINTAPVVFVPPSTAHYFDHQPANSGTAAMRARINASLFYDSLVIAAEQRAKHAAERQEKAEATPCQ